MFITDKKKPLLPSRRNIIFFDSITTLLYPVFGRDVPNKMPGKE